jgi:hypothetical protein
MKGLFSRQEWLAVGSLGLILLFLAEGCVQVSKISTEPEGAMVSVNGAPMGTTPIYYNTRSGVPKGYFVTIEKPGFQQVETKLETSYRADASLLFLIPGLIPYVFTSRLEDEYKFTLQPNGQGKKKDR